MEIEGLKEGTNAGGTHRVRYAAGWVSKTSGAGEVVLEEVLTEVRVVQEAHRGCAQPGCGARAGWRARDCSLSGGGVKGCCCVACSASVSGGTS